jgi:hypothetical protein
MVQAELLFEPGVEVELRYYLSCNVLLDIFDLFFVAFHACGPLHRNVFRFLGVLCYEHSLFMSLGMCFNVTTMDQSEYFRSPSQH